MYIFLIFTLLLLFLNNQSNAQNSVSTIYQHLASYCNISDYSLWLQKQASLKKFLRIAHHFELDENTIKQIERDLKRYRSEHECLKFYERFPIIVGGG